MATDGSSKESARVRRACLDLMYAQTRTAWLSNAFCIALIWIAFRDNADVAWLLGWTTACAIMMVVRDVRARQYQGLADASIDVMAWTRWLEWSLLANGMLWGVACAALTLIATPYQWPVIVLIAGGLQTGSVLASSYLMRTFFLFSVPLFACTLLAFLWLGFGGQPRLLVTAALLMVWSLFIFACAARFSRHYRQSISYGFENLDLAESLQSKNKENEALNVSLRDRIDELKATQRQLLVEKERSDGLVEQLRTLSTTDGLTGLKNRRSFNESLNAEWRRAQRRGEPLTLAIADVDHFKAYNDLYGHQAGDACLKHVANVLAGVARRAGDCVARYGGEEFVLILPQTDLKAGVATAERALEALRALALPHQGSKTAPHVTMSIGIASKGLDHSQDAESLLACADEALYEAKQLGRNQVVTASGLDDVRSGSHVYRLQQG
ncbi:MAG: GGDEF domain-containing protein [Pseudomonadota bacterium]